jgi:hypothetical protein
MDETIRDILERAGWEPDREIAYFVEQLAFGDSLPRAAIAICAIRIDEAAPLLRAALARILLGGVPSESDSLLVFRGLHILGAARDTKTFKPLLRLLRRSSDEIDQLLGDAITEGLSNIVTGVFDGDADALFEALADQRIDEYVRNSLFGAATFLAWEGRIDRDALARFLVRFFDQHLAEDGDYAWAGWQQAVALLGLSALEPLVTQAFAEERISPQVMDKSFFDTDLAVALRAPDDIERFKQARLGYIEDVLGALEWTDREEAPSLAFDEQESDEDDWFPPPAPVVNPMRNVGRNDPCPCGSGKKYKKCCLV